MARYKTPIPPLKPCPKCGAAAVPIGTPPRISCSSWSCGFEIKINKPGGLVAHAAEKWNDFPREDDHAR